MNTPVLTKLQKKLSLSGKKHKKEIMKNVMSNPHKAYWPLIGEELSSLTQVLTEHLPRVRVRKGNVPWKVLKDISKEERKQTRDYYIKKNYPSVDIIKEENLIFGVNDVTKCLESDECAVVLVADVTPRILIKHVIDLSILHRVPTLVIPGMKQILEDSCGLKSIVVAIKRSLPKDSNLNNIILAVKEISENYAADSLHINSEKLKEVTLHNEKIHATDSLKEAVPEKIREPKPKNLGYHLHRASLSERAFVPKINENYGKAQQITNFLSFSSSSNDDSNVPIKGNILYKPLKVKRLRANKNRHRDKIEKLKLKKKT